MADPEPMSLERILGRAQAQAAKASDPIDDTTDEGDGSDAAPVLPESFWKREAKLLFTLLAPLVLAGALKGAKNAGKDLESRTSVTIDYDLVNKQAAKWAKDYTFDLVKGITDTTRTYLQDKVSGWVESGKPLPDLIDELQAGGMFDERRAELVASTETTRSYSAGSRTAWVESGVVTGREWKVAEDELVCPVCGGLNGQVVGIDEPFKDDAGNEIDDPPAHPRCRCWTHPVVEE